MTAYEFYFFPFYRFISILFFRDGTHGEAVSPNAVVPEPIAGIEVQDATVAGAVGRGRPIVAVRTHIAQGT